MANNLLSQLTFSSVLKHEGMKAYFVSLTALDGDNYDIEPFLLSSGSQLEAIFAPSPRGYLAVSGDSFGCPDRVSVTGIQWVEPRDAAKYFAVHIKENSVVLNTQPFDTKYMGILPTPTNSPTLQTPNGCPTVQL